jgi:hypothetical protein
LIGAEGTRLLRDEEEATEKVTFNKKLEFFKNQIPKTSVFHLESGDFHPVYYAFY